MILSLHSSFLLSPPCRKSLENRLIYGMFTFFVYLVFIIVLLIVCLYAVYEQYPDLILEGGTLKVTAMFQDVTGKSVVLLSLGRSDDGAHSQNEKIDRDNYIKGVSIYYYYYYYYYYCYLICCVQCTIQRDVLRTVLESWTLLVI